MAPCLVQQLFRLKIGKELDPSIVDEVLFPMLFKQKHPSKELLLDIKMTLRNQNGDSMIALPDENVSPFTKIPPTSGLSPDSVRAEQEVAEKERLGKVTSRFRREMTRREDWGAVDILNELRELKHPVIEFHPVPDSQRHVDHPWGIRPWFPDLPPSNAYICLEETSDFRLKEIVVAVCAVRDHRGKSPLYSNDKMLRDKEKAIIKEDLQFVNRYLEHSLSQGGLYWVTEMVGEPGMPAVPSLSTYY
jgi:hypothetical protein